MQIYSLSQRVDRDIAYNMFIYIKENEVEQLRNLLESKNIDGLSQIVFEIDRDDDETILKLFDEQELKLSEMSPIEIAIAKKSTSCLKLLI